MEKRSHHVSRGSALSNGEGKKERKKWNQKEASSWRESCARCRPSIHPIPSAPPRPPPPPASQSASAGGGDGGVFSVGGLTNAPLVAMEFNSPFFLCALHGFAKLAMDFARLPHANNSITADTT